MKVFYIRKIYRKTFQLLWNQQKVPFLKETIRKLTFSVQHLNAIKSTAGRSFLGIKPLPALQQM
jgi:hypothetical protein